MIKYIWWIEWSWIVIASAPSTFHHSTLFIIQQTTKRNMRWEWWDEGWLKWRQLHSLEYHSARWVAGSLLCWCEMWIVLWECRWAKLLGLGGRGVERRETGLLAACLLVYAAFDMFVRRRILVVFLARSRCISLLWQGWSIVNSKRSRNHPILCFDAKINEDVWREEQKHGDGAKIPTFKRTTYT